MTVAKEISKYKLNLEHIKEVRGCNKPACNYKIFC
jgi:hypothetical protein